MSARAWRRGPPAPGAPVWFAARASTRSSGPSWANTVSWHARSQQG